MESGERREYRRRQRKPKATEKIQLPFLDDEWDNNASNDDSIKPDFDSIDAEAIVSAELFSAALSSDDVENVDMDTLTNDASDDEAMDKNTSTNDASDDDVQSKDHDPDESLANNSSRSKNADSTKNEEAISNRTAECGNKSMDNPKQKKELTNEEEARLAALKSMLNASNARHRQASRKRRPAFAAGLDIKVMQGEHMGKVGVVVDADYIENRALVMLADNDDSPRWFAFDALGHVDQ